MADRCYVQVSFRQKDFDEHCLSEFFTETQSQNCGFAKSLVAINQEASYGYADELEEWASEDIPFHGFSGEGDNYDSQVFASDGAGNFISVSAQPGTGKPIVTVEKNELINQTMLSQARKYLEILAAAKAAIEEA